jgi:hypothetical protein
MCKRGRVAQKAIRNFTVNIRIFNKNLGINNNSLQFCLQWLRYFYNSARNSVTMFAVEEGRVLTIYQYFHQ